jgi:hypothetical protein
LVLHLMLLIMISFKNDVETNYLHLFLRELIFCIILNNLYDINHIFFWIFYYIIINLFFISSSIFIPLNNKNIFFINLNFSDKISLLWWKKNLSMIILLLSLILFNPFTKDFKLISFKESKIIVISNVKTK